MEMKKDGQIEEKFRTYTEGVELPQIDLTAAKRALSEEGRETKQRRAKRRGKWLGALSACACVIVALVLVIRFLPSAPPAGGEVVPAEYSYLEARAEHTNSLPSYLSSGIARKLEPFSHSANANAEYTLYFMEGRERAVLLRGEINFIQNGTRMRAEIFFDLAGGEYIVTELESYHGFTHEGYRYTYELTEENGEHVGRANLTLYGVECCVSVMSSDSNAIFTVVDYLRS